MRHMSKENESPVAQGVQLWRIERNASPLAASNCPWGAMGPLGRPPLHHASGFAKNGGSVLIVHVIFTSTARLLVAELEPRYQRKVGYLVKPARAAPSLRLRKFSPGTESLHVGQKWLERLRFRQPAIPAPIAIRRVEIPDNSPAVRFRTFIEERQDRETFSLVRIQRKIALARI